MYVLGSTPKWAASNTKQGTYPNKGAASNPKSIKDWKNWVTAVVKRYGELDRVVPDLERGQPHDVLAGHAQADGDS